MTGITDEELSLLRERAIERAPGRWAFGHAGYSHDPAGAVAIISACLALGVPVTDVLTAEAWNKVVTRLATLEARVSELERADNHG